MRLKKYEDLPEFMKCKEVKEYYDLINKKKIQLLFKRWVDILGSIVGIMLLSPIMLIISIIIKVDSSGPALFKQIRVTQYGRKFKILKFRTMVVDAESKGAQVTSKNDSRVTRVGKFLRKCRLDELPQIFNIFMGELSFVGTRPEVPKYVDKYTNEMLATLLLPAGVTSNASIEYKDEENILNSAIDVESVYIGKVLPEKMNYNLEYLKRFEILYDVKIMIKTVIAVL
ncbi:sugar transferase [Clostridium paraputrificum]|uniref:sugar transferase n=1 Tax=Clostridium paraputrificum TaxID=29363 RepID=UPI0006BF83DF|nr:sugar transferase [Clostridium paraputrificum]CUQ42825.1 sugar transferase [Clostridium paraputrificum]